MKYYIGIDLGGTNVRVAKIDDSGTIVEDIKKPSLAKEGPSAVVENLKEMIHKISNLEEVKGIGIGVPGPVDTYRGVMTMATNLPGFEEYPMAKVLMEEFNIPVFVDNDANVAGLAEAVVGAGKGKPIVYYITHSTGIGGALVVDGKVVSGRNGYAGEVGNIIIDRNRKKYNHLNPGAIENEASGTAMGRIASEEISPEVNSAAKVFDLARLGDFKALEIVDRISYDFATMMSAVGHVCDPHIFVIGGGCTNASDLYFDKLRKYYNDLVHVGMRDVTITKAILKEPGVIGAAMLCKSHGI